MQAVYPERLDTLIAALERDARSSLTWQRPAGGFYLWLRLAGGLRAREVLTEAIARGVAFVPGDLYHVDGGGRDTIRLAFSGLTPDQLTVAARRLSEAVAAVEERRRQARSAAGRVTTRIV